MDSAATPHKGEHRKTPLNALHSRLGAKMVNFGGWDMPVEYPSSGGLMAEHKAVRGSVGVFDVSHMGDIRIRGGGKPGGALAAVQHISMNDASKLTVGQLRRVVHADVLHGRQRSSWFLAAPDSNVAHVAYVKNAHAPAHRFVF